MATLRTPEGEKKYQDYIKAGGLDNGCPLCRDTARKTFTYWKIVSNDFPYDRVAGAHDMVVPLRHITEHELTAEELEELREIKHSYINDTYDYVIEAVYKKKSIPKHFHLHLVTLKE